MIALIHRTIALAAVVLVSLSPALAQSTSGSALGNKEPWKSETAVGDLVADAVRDAVRADIGFVTASELKTTDAIVPAGKVSAGDITALISYADDPPAKMSLSGAQVRQALEKSVGSYPSKNQGFLQVSGLKFTFDPKKPSGSRVQSVTVGGKALNEQSSYTVAVSSSLANGALGYWKVWTKDSITQRYADLTAVKAVGTFLERNSRIDYSKLDRIRAASGS